jgi:DNA-binding NtrC family response regulator
MKIVIVENELYLAQSIASKLNEHGFSTEIFSSIKEAMHSSADVYLLSTNLPGQVISPLIRTFKHKIIIMMVNYINNDTVVEPLNLGAKDYIVKPFMIEELIRKIEHYQEYQNLKKQMETYQTYIDKLLKELSPESELDTFTTPLIIRTNYPKLVDKVVFNYTKAHNKSLLFLPVDEPHWGEKLQCAHMHTLIYVTEVHHLKKAEKKELLEKLKPYNFILCCTTEVETPHKTITLNTENKLYDQNEILTLDDYVKYIVNHFQHKFPDTELSKKLGISRKSLWEKRRKYGLFKKK